jgi:hypothetical protein
LRSVQIDLDALPAARPSGGHVDVQTRVVVVAVVQVVGGAVGLRAPAPPPVLGGVVVACAVTVWRHLVLAELRAAHERANPPGDDLIPARAEPAKPASAAPAADPAQALPAVAPGA